VAAHLAAGVAPSRFGKRIHDHLRLDFFRPRRTGKHVWTGLVLHVDRFGNLVTNFRVDEFPDVATRPFEMNVGLDKLSRLALNFSEAQPGELAVIVGSSGYLEVVANQASAAKRLGCGAGAPVELVL
jgi:S-adenosylmethionine hydrolase